MSTPTCSPHRKAGRSTTATFATACGYRVNATGLTGLPFHDLRHANATGLVADGVDVKTAQTRLGHSDPRLTLAIYAQAVTEADRAAADKLAKRFMVPREDARETAR